MQRAQRAYRNFKKADTAFKRASANLHKSQYISNLIYFPNVTPRQAETLRQEYKKVHQNVLNAYARRNKAHAVFVQAAGKFMTLNNNRIPVNQIKNDLNQLKYAPPNRPGGFGGIGYEMAAMRWRKKPARAVSVSPKRRVSPKRPHSV